LQRQPGKYSFQGLGPAAVGKIVFFIGKIVYKNESFSRLRIYRYKNNITPQSTEQYIFAENKNKKARGKAGLFRQKS
jgi:hypothetical protein